MAYPDRSVIADFIPGNPQRPDARARVTVFFECLIAMALLHIEQCRAFKITPLAFFDHQVLPEFHLFQKAFADDVWNLYKDARAVGVERGERSEPLHDNQNPGPEPPFSYQHYLNQRMGKYKDVITTRFTWIKTSLEEKQCNGYFTADASSLPRLSEERPGAVMCFDETRQLFLDGTDEPEYRFLALQRAMGHQSTVSRGRSERRFFGLVLDTSSSVSNFSPPQAHDKSLKIVNPSLLYAPIFGIDTMDVLGEAHRGKTPLTVANMEPSAGRLYRLGRPLWGSIMETQGE